MRTVILIHGFWHGSWCWSRVTEQLAADGVRSVAVDADGHGLNSRSPVSRWGRPFDPAAFAPVTGSPARHDVVSPDNAGELVSGLLAADPAVVGALRIDPGDLGRHAAIREVREPLQRRLVSDIDSISKNPTDVVEFDSSHSPFLSRPAELAAAIAELC